MKILLITPTSEQVVGFRKNLIEHLQKEKYDVSVLTFDDKFRNEIEDRNIDFHCVEDKNRSLNPFKILSLKKRYCKEIRNISPDIVFTFMLKPNIFGVKAAKKAGVKKIFSMVEGAGDVFINNGIKWKTIRYVVCKMYRSSFNHCKKVFFLNNDDKSEFINRKLVKPEQCEIVHGIGVDLERFAYKPVKNHKAFLMVARMLKTKGVFEYCNCARLVKQKYPDAEFNYLGAEGTVKITDIQEYIDDGSINYLGTTDDIRPYFCECAANILPSYREGFGLVNAEAGAIGRLSVTCQTNGTRDTVIDGQTGFLVPIKDEVALAEKVIWCIEHPIEVVQMGKNARFFVEENFDQVKITKYIVEIIEGEKMQSEYNPLISIIVPVYNAEAYIERCVKSIQNQTYTHFELILINDGSTDNSLEICRMLARQDKRVVILDRPNGGAGAARNTGLDHIRGQYVVFADSDDYVSKNYLENLYLATKSGHYDIVQCNLKSTNKQLNTIETIPFELSDVTEITKVQALNERRYKVSVCGKIYSAHIFDDFRFKEGIIYEDDASYYIFIDRADKIAVLNETLYYYYMSENSVMRNNKKNKSIAFIEIYEERIKYFKERNNQKLLDGTYDRFCLVLMLTISSSMKNGNNLSDIGELKHLFLQNYPKVMKSRSIRIRDKVMFTFFRIAPKTTGRIIGRIRG